MIIIAGLIRAHQIVLDICTEPGIVVCRWPGNPGQERIFTDIQYMLQIFGLWYPEQQGYCGYLVKFCWQACLVFWAPDWQRPALLLHSLTWAAGEMLLMFQMVRNWNQLFVSSFRKKPFSSTFFFYLGVFIQLGCQGECCWNADVSNDQKLNSTFMKEK